MKVVRDPAKRCVSSYRHALKHGYEDEKMSRVRGREIHHKVGYSYETFLEHLGQIDLHHCNIHHRVQKHSLDTVSYGRTWLINVDEQDLDEALAEIDHLQGCAPLHDDKRSAEMIEHDARRYANAEGDKSPRTNDLWRTPLSLEDVGKWPKRSLISSVPANELVRRIYRCDYDMLLRA